MATNLGHDDVTVTLDELYANNTVAQLLPQDEILKSWRMVSEGSAKNINARGAFYMLQTRQPNNIRAKAFSQATAGQKFPEPTKSKYMTMNLSAIVDEATLQWDGNVDVQNQAGLKQKPAKDLDYVERELEGIYEAYARDKARQLWQSRENEVGMVSAVNTGTRVVTCNHASNLFGSQLIEEGDILEVRDAAFTLRGYVQVESVYRPTKTFVIDANYIHNNVDATVTLVTLAIANGDHLYPRDGYNNGYAGIPYLTATSGAFQSVADRTIHDHLTGVSIDGTGRAISAALMRRLRSARRSRRYGKKSKGKFFASAQLDGYESTGWATQSYGQTSSLDMGYADDELRFDGKGFQWDYYVPKTAVFEVDMSAIDRFELREFKPLRGENGYKYRAPGDDRHYDKENIYLKGIGNLGCQVPAAVGGVLTNLSTAGLTMGDD